MSATYEVRGDVAVISLNNPPVNGLGYDTRRGIAEGLERAAAESGVKAIVITGAGKAFSGGADIREFGSPKAIAEPSLPNLILAIEGSAKPVVAALHSVAMGGGLELALGCHYRVAVAGLQDRLSRGQDRPAAGGRRHPAISARARPRDRAQPDRQRRDGRERRARQDAGPEADRQAGRRRCRRRCGRVRAGEGRRAAAAADPQPEGRAPERAGLPPVRAQHGRRDEQELPGAAEERRRGGGVDDDEVRRRHPLRARAFPRHAGHAREQGAAPRVHGRARDLEDPRRARRPRRPARSTRSR